MLPKFAIVRLSEHFYIEDNIYKYKKPTFDKINYFKLFKEIDIKEEDKNCITFGYCRIDIDPIEFEQNNKFLLIDLTKCENIMYMNYYTWTDCLFYSMNVYKDYDNVFEHSIQVLKRNINNLEELEYADKIQCMFKLNKNSIIKELKFEEVIKYYNTSNIK